MERYREIINKYKKSLLGLDHVVGVGYGVKEKKGRKTGEEAIIVLVSKKMPSNRLNKRDIIPAAVGDYKTDVIEIGELDFMESRTVRMRPAQPGISIGHYKVSAGTLGAVVRDKRSGKPMILSNNHVLANITNGRDGRAKVGDPILQPGKYDDGSNPEDIIGHLARFVPVRTSEDGETCPIAGAVEKLANFLIHFFKPHYYLKFLKESASNLVDCALAKPTEDKVLRSEILGIGEIKGIREPEVGMKVRKSGRTTGVTRGEIKAINSTVEVRMSQTEVAVFEDQFITEPISKAGDSGSLVVDMDNNVVGLLFAGSDKATVSNRITNVMDALEIEF